MCKKYSSYYIWAMYITRRLDFIEKLIKTEQSWEVAMKLFHTLYL